jgi:hypothetical protein
MLRRRVDAEQTLHHELRHRVVPSLFVDFQADGNPTASAHKGVLPSTAESFVVPLQWQ